MKVRLCFVFDAKTPADETIGLVMRQEFIIDEGMKSEYIDQLGEHIANKLGLCFIYWEDILDD